MAQPPGGSARRMPPTRWVVGFARVPLGVHGPGAPRRDRNPPRQTPRLSQPHLQRWQGETFGGGCKIQERRGIIAVVIHRGRRLETDPLFLLQGPPPAALRVLLRGMQRQLLELQAGQGHVLLVMRVRAPITL